jgi:hypothetical protein
MIHLYMVAPFRAARRASRDLIVKASVACLSRAQQPLRLVATRETDAARAPRSDPVGVPDGKT